MAAADLVNPDYRGSQYTITSSICLALMIILLALRLYSKRFISHTLSFDDGEHNSECPARDMLTLAAICVLAAVSYLQMTSLLALMNF